MPLGEADAAAIFASLHALGEGVAIKLGTQLAYGVLRNDQQVLTDRGLVGRAKTLEFATAKLTLAVDDQPTIDGVAYVVRDVYPTDDAAVSLAVVEPV